MRLQLEQLAEKVLGVNTGQINKVLNPVWCRQQSEEAGEGWTWTPPMGRSGAACQHQGRTGS